MEEKKNWLIDAGKLMEDPVWKFGGDPYDQYYMGYQDAMDNVECVIDAQPTVDAVEVVRCKHCRYYDPTGDYCDCWGGVRHPEHFCGEGDREGND